MRRLARAAVIVTVFAPVPSAAADVVHRVDGPPVLGLARPAGAFAPLVVDTLDGPVDVPRAEITHVEDARSLERSFAATSARLSPDDVEGRLRLVDWALRKGRFEDALDAADEALARADEGADVLLPPLLFEVPIEGVLRNRPLDGVSAERLLAAASDRDRPARARVAGARLRRGADDPGVRERLLDALEERRATVRAAASRALGGSCEPTVLPALLERVLEDQDGEVRAAATEAVANGAAADPTDERLAVAVVRGLRRDDPRRRAAALDAAEALHVTRAVGQLVRNLQPRGSSPAPSGSTSVVQQRAFVQDFDVDVANSAFIANPNVGVLQSGVVLNATLLDTTPGERGPSSAERRRIAAVLAGLTGADHGEDARRWAEWLEQQRR